jgi:hypothetical protein
VLHAVACTTAQPAGASAVSQAALGAIGAALGLPLGLGTYLLFKAMAGGGFTGSPPPLALALIALAAIAIAAAGAVPALLAPTRPGQPRPRRRIGYPPRVGKDDQHASTAKGPRPLTWGVGRAARDSNPQPPDP